MLKEKLLILSLLPVILFGQVYKSYTKTGEGISIHLSEGTIQIILLADNCIRVQYDKDLFNNFPELIFTNKPSNIKFEINEDNTSLNIITRQLNLKFNKNNCVLSFADNSGKVFLSELENSRIFTPDTIMGEPCFKVDQSFYSPADEALFGLGQFQDGLYNLKGITRRLTQVNSQISLPFIYSSKGYGLLWHQYGLTDFNPADNYIKLEKQELLASDDNQMVEVTTTSGTQRISQEQSIYNGSFSVPRDGVYSLFLDLGDMGNRQLLIVDGKACIDQTNWWLPPTAGTLIHLNEGLHKVQVVCKSINSPTLSWKIKDNSTTFSSPNAKLLDYVVFYGPSADSVIKTYRELSGNAPMFPLWAYGFWQCRERYTSGPNLVETVKEFRKRRIPLDVIVQDWQYWGNRGWGVPQFDTINYANPSGFIKELHTLNVHFNISIWSNPDKNSTIGKEYVSKNRYIPDTKWLDYFNPETGKEYWNTLNENLFVHGVDSWWMDATEPENDALKGVRTYMGPGNFYRLTYPMFVSQAVYEGQRKNTSDKRVCILTRSAFLGQQRYGIINWSGDIGGTWDSFRRQIVAGLNYSISGLSYWTTDIGGFFRPGTSQYTDKAYHELLIRWFQYGTFNPIFRVHGYQSETEPWKFGQQTEDAIRKMIDLRYSLLPYIYSEAWQISKNGSTMMRPLIMDFKDDTAALNRQFEFMFGKSILVCPVTQPMYKLQGKNMIDSIENQDHNRIKGIEVYLPLCAGWYDFWTGERLNGGQTICRDVPLEIIPVYIKAGSILPFGPRAQYTTENSWDSLEIHVFPGADGQFALYEDENDNYNYEKGTCSTIRFLWNEKKHELCIEDRNGEFPGMLKDRVFIVFMADSKNQIDKKYITYKGKKTEVRF